MGIILFIIVLAVLILVHEFGHFVTAKKTGMRVDEFGIGFPPSIASWKPERSETTYSINAIPFGGFVKIHGEDYEGAAEAVDHARSFSYQSKWAQALVLVAGVLMNALFAWLLIVIAFMAGIPTSSYTTPVAELENPRIVVTEVLSDTPAAEAGLAVGDRILAADDYTYADDPSLTALSEEIASDDEVALTVLRGDEELAFTVPTAAGIVGEGPAIGISMDIVGLKQYGVLASLVEGTRTTMTLTRDITVALYNFFADAFTGEADFSQVAGPVGIVGLVGQSADLGFVYLLMFTAVISLHLAIINLLPIPALDGGRLLFVIIEAIKGSPIRPKVAQMANTIGFAILLLLMVIVTISDVVKLF